MTCVLLAFPHLEEYEKLIRGGRQETPKDPVSELLWISVMTSRSTFITPTLSLLRPCLRLTRAQRDFLVLFIVDWMPKYWQRYQYFSDWRWIMRFPRWTMIQGQQDRTCCSHRSTPGRKWICSQLPKLLLIDLVITLRESGNIEDNPALDGQKMRQWTGGKLWNDQLW